MSPTLITGVYTLGPCPVAAVKKGICTVKYDTAFVFAEVNADEVHWELLPGGGEKQLDLFKSKYVASTPTRNLVQSFVIQTDHVNEERVFCLTRNIVSDRGRFRNSVSL